MRRGVTGHKCHEVSFAAIGLTIWNGPGRTETVRFENQRERQSDHSKRGHELSQAPGRQGRAGRVKSTENPQGLSPRQGLVRGVGSGKPVCTYSIRVWSMSRGCSCQSA